MCYLSSAPGLPGANKGTQFAGDQFAPDPLAVRSIAQKVANRTGHMVRANKRPIAVVPYVDGYDTGYMYSVFTDAQGKGGGEDSWVEVRPEPVGPQLDDLARTAGLHTAQWRATEQVRDTVQRLAYLLRLTMGDHTSRTPPTTVNCSKASARWSECGRPIRGWRDSVPSP
jgi:hypothetical protein